MPDTWIDTILLVFAGSTFNEVASSLFDLFSSEDRSFTEISWCRWNRVRGYSDASHEITNYVNYCVVSRNFDNKSVIVSMRKMKVSCNIFVIRI